MNRHLRDNLIFIAVSVIAFTSEPAVLNAEQNPYNPINFTERLNLSRGSLSPISPDGLYLNAEETCKFVQQEWAWEKQSCGEIEALIFAHQPGVDSLMVMAPNSQGHVKFDDWNEDSLSDEIDTIWQEFSEGARAQGEKLGVKIEPVKWQIYPTLDKEKSIMYYAILMNWGGEMNLNVRATLFDRRGYVPFSLIPADPNVSESEVKRMVVASLDSYGPKAEESYFDFKDGDKIAAAGALGVLATLVGVKYGKGAFAAILGVILVLAKKFWFILLVPLVFLKNLIFKKKT